LRILSLNIEAYYRHAYSHKNDLASIPGNLGAAIAIVEARAGCLIAKQHYDTYNNNKTGKNV